jgi:uncharacterized protein (TIGR00251 family)
MMLRDSGDEVRLAVHVQPRARSTGIAGMHGDALKIRLTAPPVGGAANEALLDLLSDVIGVARSNMRIVSGATSRDKTVGIRGVTIDAVRRALLP